MWNGFIGQQIQRSNRNLLRTNLLVLLIPTLIGALGLRYWQNFFAGPAPITAQELAQIQSPDAVNRYFVSVQGSKSLDTGFEEITQRKAKYSGTVTSQSVSAKFVAIVVDQKLLLVKTKPGNDKQTAFTGSLEAMPAKVQNEFIKQVEADVPNLKGAFLPYMLNQSSDFYGIGYFGLGIGVPLAALALWNLNKVRQRRAAPQSHPLAKQLAKAGDLEMVVSQIDQDHASGKTQQVGSMTVTPSWMMHASTYSMTAVPFKDLIWFYQKVTTHRVNGIPTRKSYTIVTCDRAGKTSELATNQHQIEQTVTLIQQKAPWAIAGYSDDLQKMWNKERDQMIQAVDQYRADAA
jgi:hypothetical protein